MIRRTATLMAALTAAGAALAAQPAAAEIKPGQQEGLGLTASNVPELLKKAKTDPYAPTTCDGAYQEVAELDQVLGPDADEQANPKSQTGNLLLKGARSLIPYREVFRVVTGVDRKERELAEAAMAGWARRGYLKGYLRNQCSGGAEIAEANAAGGPAADLASDPAETSTAYVSTVGGGLDDAADVSTSTLASTQGEVNPSR
ncbi:hypothetical protein [Phenylobacterium sp.]|jgi:hypothetical protein|uniref:hypothetical protein n=1 Tax=Phenylobacterium sp. TaxID=1871053 RepID=UPI002F9562E1